LIFFEKNKDINLVIMIIRKLLKKMFWA